MKKLLLLIVLILIVWGSWKLLGNVKVENTANAETYKVGVMVLLTGDAAVYGEPALNLYRLALEEINEAGGVNGRKLELVVEDSKCNGKDGANASQKLINVDKVQVIVGGFCSSESLSAAPIAAAAKVTLFSPGSSSPALTNVSPFFFRNYPSDATQGKVLAEIAYNDKKWKNVAFIQEQTDYALGVNKAFSENFTVMGGKVTKEEFPSSTTDFRSILAKIKSQNPDALFVDSQTPAAAARIFKQLQDMKWSPKLLVSDAVSGDPETVSTYKTLLEDTLAAEFGNSNNSKFKHMVDIYKAKHNVEPPYQGYAQTEFDALFMVVDGIKTVGYNGAKLASWSRTIKEWEGASGKVTIQADGDRASGHVAKVIKSGKVELYK